MTTSLVHLPGTRQQGGFTVAVKRRRDGHAGSDGSAPVSVVVKESGKPCERH
jgi:hypothetical protein